ncbi:MAG: tRNA pseudouridine(55) synthase TruB [Gemmatimonadota bacterium]
MSSINGVLLVDKPIGPTSHDIVAVARRALGERRIGHTGTLDPFASGLLVLCLGPSTRLAEYLTGLPKSYSATLTLGRATDTDDLEGETVSTSEEWRAVTLDRLEAAFAPRRGEIQQVPPRYSAKKVDGRRMYEVARAGGETTAKPFTVTVTRLEVTRFEPPSVEFEVDCSTGTYIRAIARDVGESLGVGAHLTRLRRTRVGRYGVGDAIMPEILADSDAVAAALLSPAEAVADLPRVELDAVEAEVVKHGGSVIARPELPAASPLALLSAEGALLAIGERREDRIQPRKVFA